MPVQPCLNAVDEEAKKERGEWVALANAARACKGLAQGWALLGAGMHAPIHAIGRGRPPARKETDRGGCPQRGGTGNRGECAIGEGRQSTSRDGMGCSNAGPGGAGKTQKRARRGVGNGRTRRGIWKKGERGRGCKRTKHASKPRRVRADADMHMGLAGPRTPTSGRRKMGGSCAAAHVLHAFCGLPHPPHRRAHGLPPLLASAAHVLLDCPAYAALRASAPFSSLFPTAPSAPAPALARLHALVRVPDQYTLGAFVHACFEQRAQLLSGLESS